MGERKTESLSAAQAIRQLELRYREVIENATDGVVLMDEHGRITDFNRAAEVMFRCARADVLGKELTLLLADSIPRGVERVLHDLLGSAQPSPSGRVLELDGRRPDGTVFPLELTLSRNQSAGETFLTGVLRDNTERKATLRLQAAQFEVTRVLAESASIADATPKLLRAICENIDWEVGALWLVDRAENVLRCQGVYQVWGRANEFSALTRSTVFPPRVGLPGRVWATGKPAWIVNVLEDDNFPRAPVAYREDLHGACSFPIWNGREIDGVIEFFSRDIRQPDHRLLEMMADIGKQISQFIARTRAEDETRRTASLLQSVFDSAADGILVVDRHGKLVSFNQRIEQIWEMPHELLVNGDLSQLFEFLCPVLKEPEQFHDHGGLNEASRFNVLELKDGRSFERHSVPQRLDGKIVGRVWTIRDVTDERRAHELLFRSEARFRQLIERSPDAMALIREGRFLYANPACVAMLGYARAEELLGVALADLVQEEAATPGETGGTATPRERRFFRKNGTVVVVESAALPIELDDGPATLMVARDVTERKQLQARLAQADRMASVGVLAAGVAHEINTPLAYVTASLDFIATQLPALDRTLRAAPATSPEGTFDRIGTALAEAQGGLERVRQIVRDLKTFSRDDEERRGQVDVRRVLDSTINLVWSELRHRARLVKEYGNVLPVEGNESRLGQVFLNLLLNAVQALDETRAAENEIRVITGVDGSGWIYVDVTDNGVGIAPDVLGNIFKPFFTTKPVGVGTGLGLPICQSIVTSHRGELSVESVLGKGTRVRVRLPASGQQTPLQRGEVAPPPQEVPAPRRARVLVIDDNTAMARVLKLTLEPEHDIEVVTSGREGLERLLPDNDYDLVFCDLMMPELTGMDVYEELRRAHPGMERRLVFMTGGAFTPRAREFLDTTSNPCFEKPFDLRMAIRTLLEKQGDRRR